MSDVSDEMLSASELVVATSNIFSNVGTLNAEIYADYIVAFVAEMLSADKNSALADTMLLVLLLRSTAVNEFAETIFPLSTIMLAFAADKVLVAEMLSTDKFVMFEFVAERSGASILLEALIVSASIVAAVKPAFALIV
jgi:hypothetical protein